MGQGATNPPSSGCNNNAFRQPSFPRGVCERERICRTTVGAGGRRRRKGDKKREGSCLRMGVGQRRTISWKENKKFPHNWRKSWQLLNRTGSVLIIVFELYECLIFKIVQKVAVVSMKLFSRWKCILPLSSCRNRGHQTKKKGD